MVRASIHWRSFPTLPVALSGSLLMAAALPPLAWGPLAWIAPVPWLLLVNRGQLAGRRPYLALWLAGLAFWLIAIHWLRLPHPAVYLGWIALSAYLACYVPAFVALSRVAVHRLGVPLWLAAPVVWTGLELARAHVLTGFLMASLAHTQVRWTALIQISDLLGEYGVDFLVMLVAACIANLFRIADGGLTSASSVEPRITSNNPQSEIRNPKSEQSWARSAFALAPAVIALALALGYGHWRLGQGDARQRNSDSGAIIARIALIQGNSLADWKYDPAREHQIMGQYIELSEQAVKRARERGGGRPLDLVVWPETMFRTPLITVDPGYKPPAGATRTPEEIASYGPSDLAALVARLDTPVLVGIPRMHFSAASSDKDLALPSHYNSAALVDRDGKIIGTYDKVHRVAFGEYIPFSKWLPWLYRLAPVAGRIDAGDRPAVLELNDVNYSPNICYETVVPHVIRRQAATRAADGRAADVLVNLTNDAWYWGSSELDMHLACGVFRAIETRTPLVIAANGGISAWIDDFGRVRSQSPRQTPDVIIADVTQRVMSSWYVAYGDWFAAMCLACSVLLGVIGVWFRNPNRFENRQGDRETRRQGEY
jgi:apolipoprotein N-acyltransferase